MYARHGFNKYFKEGSTKSPERRFYDRWIWMNTRCRNKDKSRPDYKNYAGKHIKVCDRWRDFRNFRDDMWPSFKLHYREYGFKNTTLDRLDVERDYSPSNCKWATKKEQSSNTSKTIRVMFNGELMTIPKIMEIQSRSYQTIHNRIEKGIPLNKPYRKSRSVPITINS